jgi:acid phosphatase
LQLARSQRVVAVVAACCLLAAGCSGSSAADHEAKRAAPTPAAASGARSSRVSSPASTAAAAPTSVLLFVLENHEQTEALDSMPYLSSLARTYGRTTDYHAITHPSLPNYLALVAGSTFGIRDDDAPSAHPLTGSSIFDQALAHGLTAKLYAESMPGRCALASTTSYAVKHNPWAYFTGAVERRNCRRHDIPMGTPAAGNLAHDSAAGTLPRVGVAIPNICDDAHDCPLSTADSWLHRWLPQLMAGPQYRSGRLAIVVTFDEDDGSVPNTVLTVVVSRQTQRIRATAPYTHFSWLRCAETMLGLSLLRNARSARSLCPAFHL